MPAFTLQIISTPPSSRFLINARSFISALDALLKMTGAGSCHGLATEAAITAEVQAATREDVLKRADSFVQSLSQPGTNLTVIMNDKVAHPLTAEQKTLAAAFNAPPQKLTLKYFKTLTPGHFIMSNCIAPGGGSIFTEPVASLESRADQWTRIRACGAAQRTCHVFPNEGECRRWLKAWEK